MTSLLRTARLARTLTLTPRTFSTSRLLLADKEKPIFDKDGAVGSKFKADGAIGQIGEKVGGVFSKDGAVGKNFNPDGKVGGTVQEELGKDGEAEHKTAEKTAKDMKDKMSN